MAGKKEKEPVIISFTTLFRPFLSQSSGFGCQTVKILICLNHSHISRAGMSGYLNSANVRSLMCANYSSKIASVNLVIHNSKKMKL